MTLKEKLENIVGEWLCQRGLSVPDDKCDKLVKLLIALIDKCAASTFSGGEYNQDVEDCIKGTFMDKPIPAEKKECEHSFLIASGDVIICRKCGKKNPEPKPKDRIDQISFVEMHPKEKNWQAIMQLANKINEIIQWINQHKERG